MTHRPLRDNELFEIRLDRLVNKWSGSLEVIFSTSFWKWIYILGSDFYMFIIEYRQNILVVSGNFKSLITGNVPWNQTLAALYPPLPPPPHIILLVWYNRKWRKCRRYEHTAPGDHWEWRSREKLEIVAL